MNQNFSKRLDYLDDEDYNKLSTSFKKKKNEFTNVCREVDRLTKQIDKYTIKLKELKNERRIKGNLQTQLHNDLSIINRDKFPTFSLSYDTKKKIGKEYISCVIKLGTQKSIYLKEKKKLIEVLSKYDPNINTKNEEKFKYYTTQLLKSVLMEVVNFRSDKWKNQLPLFKQILSVLDERLLVKKEEKSSSWF